MKDSRSESRPSPGPEWRSALRSALLAFFQQTRGDRRMPWRETDDPYGIWVSEIMLQQTRVETVIPYWEAWMERFPTVDALAQAAEEDVLKRWEGLGYYSRARNLHKAASVVRERYGGALPGDVRALRALPGIGPYTAGAVGSIAFGIPAPAVDGNVRRVVARLLDWPDPGARELEDTVAGWIPDHAPGDFNQALMELGATVCTPRSPGCDLCPVSALCAAHEAGTVGERPEKKPKPKVRREVHGVLVAVSETESGPLLGLRQRPPGGLLAGMYEFPGWPLDDGADTATAVLSRLPPDGEGAAEVLLLEPVRHAFTHLHVTYRPVLARLPAHVPEPVGGRWYTPDEVRALPLPVAQQSIVEQALEALSGAAGDHP